MITNSVRKSLSARRATISRRSFWRDPHIEKTRPVNVQAILGWHTRRHAAEVPTIDPGHPRHGARARKYLCTGPQARGSLQRVDVMRFVEVHAFKTVAVSHISSLMGVEQASPVHSSQLHPMRNAALMWRTADSSVRAFSAWIRAS